MLIPDVNVLVGALRPDSPSHDSLRQWLADAVAGEEPVGLVDVAVSGFLRVVTHPRIFDPPTEMTPAVAAVDALLSAGLPLGGEQRTSLVDSEGAAGVGQGARQPGQ